MNKEFPSLIEISIGAVIISMLMMTISLSETVRQQQNTINILSEEIQK